MYHMYEKTKKAVAAILTLLLIVSMTACALHGKI